MATTAHKGKTPYPGGVAMNANGSMAAGKTPAPAWVSRRLSFAQRAMANTPAAALRKDGARGGLGSSAANAAAAAAVAVAVPLAQRDASPLEGEGGGERASA